MIALKTIEPVVVQTILPRVIDELTARYFYEAATAYCRSNGYPKAAAYFEKEAKQENEHYMKWIKYLSDWNVVISFPPISQPSAFTSLLDILEKAYAMEYSLYESYEADTVKALPLCPGAFGIFQEYVQIQNESVIEYNDKLTTAYNYIGTDPKLVLFESENFD